MFGITIIRTADLPFHREVDRLIKANPDYLEAIRRGMVHLKYRPGMKPVAKTVTMNTAGEEVQP